MLFKEIVGTSFNCHSMNWLDKLSHLIDSMISVTLTITIKISGVIIM